MIVIRALLNGSRFEDGEGLQKPRTTGSSRQKPEIWEADCPVENLKRQITLLTRHLLNQTFDQQNRLLIKKTV